MTTTRDEPSEAKTFAELNDEWEIHHSPRIAAIDYLLRQKLSPSDISITCLQLTADPYLADRVGFIATYRLSHKLYK